MTTTPEQMTEKQENEFHKFWDKLCDEGYKDAYDCARKSWIASRESPVAELPDHFCYELPHGGDSDDCYEKQDILNMLQSAGINYREKE